MTLHLPKSLLTSIFTAWAVVHAVAVDSSNIPWGSYTEVEVFKYDSKNQWYYGDPIGENTTDWNNSYDWEEVIGEPDSYGSTIVLLDGADTEETVFVNLQIDAPGGLIALNNTKAEVSASEPKIGYIYVEEGSSLRISGNSTYTPASIDYDSDSYSLVANGSLTFCCDTSLEVGPTKWFIGKNGSVTCDENLATINVANDVIEPFTIVAETIGLVENRKGKERIVFSASNQSLEDAIDKFKIQVVDVNGNVQKNVIWDGGDGGNEEDDFLKYGLITIRTPEGNEESAFGVVLKDDYSTTEQATLVWKNDEGKKWVQGGSGWYKEGDADKTNTGFLNGDKVVFEEGDNNVTLGGDVTFDTMAVKGNTDIKAESHQLKGKTVSLSNGVTLTVENAKISDISFATEEVASKNGTVNIVAGELLSGSVEVVDAHDSSVSDLPALMKACTLKNTDVVISATGAIDAKAIGVEDFSSKVFALNIMSNVKIEEGSKFTLTLEGMENYRDVILHWSLTPNTADSTALSLQENEGGIKIDLDTSTLGQIENYTGATVVFTSQNGVVVNVWATCSVPEPTTGTLSVLALAALCARRRRKCRA